MTAAAVGCPLMSQALTHIGYVRDTNEDTILAMPEAALWVVADGMGGHKAGALASQIIVDVLSSLGHSYVGKQLVSRLSTALHGVNSHLRAYGASLGAEAIVGSTVVALVLEGERYHCFWVGDSRIYLYRDGRLARLTRDHVVGEENGGYGAGALTRAIGAHAELEVDYVSGFLYEKDVFLLCSDGLTKVVDDSEIGELLSSQPEGIACQALVDAALSAGGPDNISCITVHIGSALSGS